MLGPSELTMIAKVSQERSDAPRVHIQLRQPLLRLDEARVLSRLARRAAHDTNAVAIFAARPPLQTRSISDPPTARCCFAPALWPRTTHWPRQVRAPS
jgi:hypothetical protein